MAGIKDVARLAGVSVSTVSYVLSGKRTISADTSKRVMDAVDKLGYIPDASAQKLRGGRNHIIALSDPNRYGMNQDEYNVYFRETAKCARAAGYDVLLLTSEDVVADIQRVTKSNLADGVILFDVAEKDARAAQAGTYAKPCVAIGYPENHDACACVDMDFAMMGRAAVQTLYDYGHRSILFLRGLESGYRHKASYMVLFRQALYDAAEELGVNVEESDLVNYATFDATDFVNKLTAGPNRPTAIVSQADALILNAVLDALDVAGVRVPSDCSVLSCNMHFEKGLTHQPISEIPYNPQILCSFAVWLLTQAIEDDRDIGGMVKLLSSELVDRGSLCMSTERVHRKEVDR